MCQFWSHVPVIDLVEMYKTEGGGHSDLDQVTPKGALRFAAAPLKGVVQRLLKPHPTFLSKAAAAADGVRCHAYLSILIKYYKSWRFA